jgi:hypothetical protein
MISALLKGKSGVIEDSLTSSVFDTLFLLPDDILWKIIRNSCFDNSNLPIYPGCIIDYEFWPHWNNKNTHNSKYVEPDLFIRFEEIDVIIEAKRENNIQSCDQWNNEITAYINEFGMTKKAVLIAIDGILEEKSEKLEKGNNFIVYIFKTKWINFYEIAIKLLNSLKISQYINVGHYKRLLNTILDYLEYYGFSPHYWLIDLFEYEYHINEIYRDITLLNNIGPKKCQNYNTGFIDSIDVHKSINYTINASLVRNIGVNYGKI